MLVCTSRKMSFYVVRLSGCRGCRVLVVFWGLGGGDGLVVDIQGGENARDRVSRF